MKYIVAITLSLLTVISFGQIEIKVEDIRNHVGDSVSLVAKVFGGKYLQSVKGSPTFLNVAGNYPNAPLTLVIWNNVRAEFPDAPDKYFKGKMVQIFGKIVLFKNKPEILIDNAKQLKLIVTATP